MTGSGAWTTTGTGWYTTGGGVTTTTGAGWTTTGAATTGRGKRVSKISAAPIPATTPAAAAAALSLAFSGCASPRSAIGTIRAATSIFFMTLPSFGSRQLDAEGQVRIPPIPTSRCVSRDSGWADGHA